MKGSVAILEGRLSRDGVGTCASGHSAGPPGVRKQLVHWWSGLNVVDVRYSPYYGHMGEELLMLKPTVLVSTQGGYLLLCF